MFNVNRRNNQFLYASTVTDDGDNSPIREPASPIHEVASPIAEPLSSNLNNNTNENNNTNRERAKPTAMAEPLISSTNTDSNIISVLNYNYKGIPLSYSSITPGAYELNDIAELIKEETDGKVIVEPDKNTMKCKMEIKQGALSFDVENSIAPLLGFRKVVYKAGIYTSQKIFDIMVLSTINIHCNVISGVKDNGNNTDILYTFTLTEPPGYLINIIPTNILDQNVTKDRIEYIKFHIKDEHGSPIDFNGDVLSFTLHLI